MALGRSAAGQYAQQIELLPPIDTPVEEEIVDDVLPEPVPALEEDVPWYVPVKWMGCPGWSRSFELGLNGSAGNTQTGGIRVGYDSEIEGQFWTTVIDINYNKAEADYVETNHNALGSLRADRELGDTPWTLFIKYGVEYDEFRDFGLRLSASTGLGYSFLESDVHKLSVSFGAGFSREFDSPDEDVIPEAAFGMKYSRQLTDRQKVSLNADYYPSWNDFMDFRLESQASWEIVIDEEWNMSMKLSVVDRYDSTPGSRRPNDMDYSLVLLWKL